MFCRNFWRQKFESWLNSLCYKIKMFTVTINLLSVIYFLFFVDLCVFKIEVITLEKVISVLQCMCVCLCSTNKILPVIIYIYQKCHLILSYSQGLWHTLYRMSVWPYVTNSSNSSFIWCVLGEAPITLLVLQSADGYFLWQY